MDFLKSRRGNHDGFGGPGGGSIGGGGWIS